MDETSSASKDMAALAAEICDLWQEHMANLAADPAAKADFMRLIEPQRRAYADLFADYTAMMQHAGHAARATPAGGETADTPSHPAQPGTARAAATAPASDDSALRLAQLAHRLAALEERVGKLESRPRRAPRGTSTPSED